MEISALEAGNKSMSIEKIFDLALKAREPKEDPMLKELIRPVLERALNPPPPPREKSLREYLEELEKLEEVLGSRRGGGRAPDSLWGVIGSALTKLAEAAPDLIRAMRGGMYVPAQFARAGAPGAGFATPQLPPFHTPGAPQPGAPINTAQPPGAPAAQPIAIDPAMIVKTRIVRLFVDNENGAFAGSYLKLEAPGIYGMLKGKSVEDVKTFMGSDEILKELVPQDGIDKFIQQMLDYVNEVEEPAAETVQ